MTRPDPSLQEQSTVRGFLRIGGIVLLAVDRMRLETRYKDAKISKMDGVSVDYPDWHFNVRPSNTEPLLRLNLEAQTPDLMARKRDEVLALIRG